MKLNLQAVLWRTRGRHWDYNYVLRPVSPLLDSWYEIHKEVFADAAPDNSPITRGGVLQRGDEKRPYLATTFRDTTRLDAAGRPVAHYIIWFPNVELDASHLLNVPKDWGRQIVWSFDDAYTKAFDLLPSALQNPDAESIERTFVDARSKKMEIILDGPVILVRLDTTVEVALPSSGTNEAEAVAGRLIRIGDTNFAKEIESAIIEGEAYALGFKGYLGTLPLLVTSFPDSDLRQRLADSFGGVSTDQFIATRMNDIWGRVAKTSLPPYPRRGLESIVEKLKQSPLESAARFDVNKREIAQLLGASVDDKVVESVVARLGSLRLLNNESATDNHNQ